jgi:hypothetical protein
VGWKKDRRKIEFRSPNWNTLRTDAERHAWFEDKTTPEPNTGCWLWLQAYASDGYGMAFYGPHRRRGIRAHRAAWEIFNGPIPEGQVVCHRCDTPACCNPAHLFLGTPSENMLDMVKKGRAPGGRDTRKKLTIEDAREVRRLAARGVSKVTLSKQFGVSRTSILMIVRYETFKEAA